MIRYFNPPIIAENKYICSHLRFAIMNIEDIPEVNPIGKIIQFENGLYVSARSTRMRLFVEKKDYACKVCGITAKIATIEKAENDNSTDRPHMNFYAIDENGDEVLMTWDHDTPKSLGGSNGLKNAQCMCTICNGLKGNNHTIDEVIEMRKEKGLVVHY